MWTFRKWIKLAVALATTDWKVVGKRGKRRGSAEGKGQEETDRADVTKTVVRVA